ncbi:hypothetical protein ABZ508_33220 [Streptomyces lavendulocolor]|uniref:Uncharacterized protein n=1 Tax=Streptomyces lavendulocolor TaxID=67316 RepID=A0ABV2WFX3_9ACTN
MAIELSDELIELETRAWAEIQAQALTVETALAVQQAVVAHAEATGQERLAVETALKKTVRHPEN